MTQQESVKVMVRARPMNNSEKGKGCNACINVNQKDNSILLTNPQDPDNQKVFTFDNVFDKDSLQSSIYEESAFQLVENVVEGFNGTIFAYGQTGCGKTHTMAGKQDDNDLKGIIPRTFSHIVKIVNNSSSKTMKYLVRCSYIEIYNENIMDLLGQDSKQKLDLKESQDKGLYIKDLSMNVVKTVEEMDKFMNIGTNKRSVGQTNMNSESSRSHSIFTLYIEASTTDENGNERFTAGKLNLVDLAGSERQSKTGASGQRLKEATKINLSLSALGNVISALVDGKSTHIPYRDSKLTRLLQDSLGGNTKTIMIANISPADYNYDETLSTLRYASRAKNIQNKPTVNEDPKDAMLKEYAKEIQKLKEMLQQQQGGGIPVQIQQQQINSNNQNQNSNVGQVMAQNSNNNDKELKEKQEEINRQTEQIQEERRIKEEQFNIQKEEKEKLEELMKQLNEKMMQKEEVDDKEKEEFQKIRTKLKKQNKQKKQIIKEKEKKEEEILNLEKQYNSLQEEADEKNQIIQKLRQHYKQSQNEINDIQREHETEKEDLLENIRESEKEVKFYQAIVEMVLRQDEIKIIQSASNWNDEKKEYTIPPFALKKKKINFPKLPRPQAMEMIEGDKNEREVVFDEKNNNQQQQYDGRNKTPSKSTYTNINNSNQQKGFKNPNVNNNNDDQFRNELHYNNHNNMNQQQYQRYDSEDVYTLNKKFNKPNSTQRLQDKKQFPKQLTPMTDLHKLTEKLEKQNSLQTNNLGNPIFQEKNKINKLNKLKPLDSQVENADNLNILLSHHQNNHNNSNVTPLQNISNKQQELKKPYKNSIKLEKLTEVAN